MPIRNPIYLDEELVQNVAEYLDVPVVDVAFQEKDSSTREGRAGLNRVVDAGGSVRGANETQRTYEVRVTPVRLMNDTVDAALSGGVVRHAEDSVSRRDLVEIDGMLELTLASEFGALLGQILPNWEPGTELDASAFTRVLLAPGEQPVFDQLFRLSDTGWDQSVYVGIRPEAFFRGRDVDDFAGEVTVFATVERLIVEGSQLALDPWLFPKSNRLVRRALAAGADLDSVVNKLAPALGRPVGEDYRVHGPALLLRPIAVY